jgi:hypothetical protein
MRTDNSRLILPERERIPVADLSYVYLTRLMIEAGHEK